jgi:hypothetical protein
MAPSDKIGRPLKVRVQVLPWLSGLIGAQCDEEINFELSLHPDSTLLQFLDELAIRRPDVAALIYDQEHGTVKATALLMLNNRAFELAGGYGALLKDGDVVTLLAAYIGG